jgi:CBS domain-containing protein
LIVKELMNTTVESIGTEATVKEAASRMAQQEIGSLIITHQDRPVGILTERDLLARVLAAGLSADDTQVKVVMSKPLICGQPEMDVSDAAGFMIQRGIKKLPITQEGLLMGIMTLTDLCAYYPSIYKLLDEMKTKLPKRFMKRMAKKYYRT